MSSVREFKTMTSPDDAAVGQSVGSVMSVSTASGTNQLPGPLYFSTMEAVSRSCRFGVFAVAAVNAALLAVCLLTAPAAASTPTFQHDILPLFQAKCIQCHGGQKPMGGLDLRSLSSALAGGASGPAIQPGQPDRSLLWKMLESGKMPMSGPATSVGEKALIREWIEKGQFPPQSAAEAGAHRNSVQEQAPRHWSFQKPVKASPPKVRNAARIRTPVDAFVLDKLEAAGWMLNGDADRVSLIRRAYFDLTGLPPTPEAVKQFVEDPSPIAYEQLIDRLLASPRYGERWGRHWLDVAGYVESTGSPGDEVRPVSWRYRDYVIRAFNQDKPYDRFLIEQLAGDQLVNYRGARPKETSTTFVGQVTDVEPGDRPSEAQMEKLIATGFLRTAPDGSDNQTIEQVDKWYDTLQVSTEVPVKAVLGLQLACARCHDHKFDPILQEDYYRFVAVFQPAYDPDKWLAANLHFGPWPARYVYDAAPGDVTKYAEAVKAATPLIAKAKGELTALYRDHRLKWIDQQRGPGSARTGANTIGASDGVAAARKEITDAELEKLYPAVAAKALELRDLEKTLDGKAPEMVWALWDTTRNPSETHLLLRGDYKTFGKVVKPGVLKFLDDPANPFPFPEPDPSWNHTGRRLTLARWITRPDHPLTSRVFVNRVWQYHFGQGIVRTPDDFGSQGARPTHPELLDWLAVSFMENGWSVKWLHRQIMLSTAYRQSSDAESRKLSADPSNKLIWRKEPQRLEAEAIRDAMLDVAGELDGTMFGKSVSLKTAPDGQAVADTSRKGDRRRSIYVLSKRTELDNFLQVFDSPIVETNVPARFRSATPQQSLALMNGPLALQMATRFSERVRREPGGDVGAIKRAYQLAFQREPSEGEVSLAYGLIHRAEDKDGAWRTFCQALFGTNEFLYVF